jgi:hypothetical protein
LWVQTLDFLRVGSADDLHNFEHLFLACLPFENRLVPQEFRETAACAPDIDSLAVLFVAHDEFGRAVPPRADVGRAGFTCLRLQLQKAFVIRLITDVTCNWFRRAEVANDQRGVVLN